MYIESFVTRCGQVDLIVTKYIAKYIPSNTGFVMAAGTRFAKKSFSWLHELNLQPKTNLFATVYIMNMKALK